MLPGATADPESDFAFGSPAGTSRIAAYKQRRRARGSRHLATLVVVGVVVVMGGGVGLLALGGAFRGGSPEQPKEQAKTVPTPGKVEPAVDKPRADTAKSKPAPHPGPAPAAKGGLHPSEPAPSAAFEKAYAEARGFNADNPAALGTADNDDFKRVQWVFWVHLEPQYQGPAVIGVGMATWHLIEPATRREIVAAVQDPTRRDQLTGDARDKIVKLGGRRWLDR
jgi:hypothetical protein